MNDNLENKHTIEQLVSLQLMTFEEKVGITQTRILEWYVKNENECYVSFSGGKDSTVLAHLCAQVCLMLNCKLVLWFSDTGLEFPELRKHVKSYSDWLKNKFADLDIEVILDYPKDRNGKRITFKEVVTKYGYPLISKEQAQYINECKYTKSEKLKNIRMNGNKYGRGKISKKYLYLLDAPFDISHKCCAIMKKNPAKKFEKDTGLKPIVGTMTVESANRKSAWLRHGCNAFESKRPISQPMSFWYESDVIQYISRYNLPYPSIYGEIKCNENGKYYTTGYQRTGCMFCGFGCQYEKEPNKFQMLKKTHPKTWEYCMKPISQGGLGMKEILKYIDVKIE